MGGTKRMAKLKDVYEAIDNFAPFSTQLDYDNSGIKIGDKEMEVTGILVTLDTTLSVIMEAKERGCNVIIEHHPSIWNPLYDIDYSLPLNQCLIAAIKFDIAIISAHTNVDIAKDGLNDYVARLMGLKNVHCLNTQSSARIGELDSAVSMKEYAKELSLIFQDNNVRTVGDLNKSIKKVAVINGGGGSDAQAVIDTCKDGCDVFVTSDVKHNVGRLAKDLNYGIINISHHASELGFIPLMVDTLNEILKETRILSTTVLENPYN